MCYKDRMFAKMAPRNLATTSYNKYEANWNRWTDRQADKTD